MKRNDFLFLPLIILGCLMSTFVRAQDTHFSQFWMAPLQQNPALAGINYMSEGNLIYKNQWSSISSPYKTFYGSGDIRIDHKTKHNGFWGVGADILSDKAGDGQMGTFQANLSLAYHIELNDRQTIGAGLSGGYAQHSINYSNLQWASQYDGTGGYASSLPAGATSAINNYSYLETGAGITWSYHQGSHYLVSYDKRDAEAGIAVFRPYQPEYSFFQDTKARLDPKFVAHCSARIDLPGGNYSLIPGLLYYRQGPLQELMLGTLVRYSIRKESRITGYVKGSAIALGLYYRVQDACVVSMLYEMGLFALGCSYDVNVSELRTASSTRGGMEITLRFQGIKNGLWKGTSNL
jgi:type IX secretion system PorP/SprF family membrane protein